MALVYLINWVSQLSSSCRRQRPPSAARAPGVKPTKLHDVLGSAMFSITVLAACSGCVGVSQALRSMQVYSGTLI
jgi:hypothetical protein